MGDELKVTVTSDNFSEKDTDEKLDLIFHAVSTQQEVCAENINKCATIPKRNRKVDLGVGAGTGIIGGTIIIKFIDLIKSYTSGG